MKIVMDIGGSVICPNGYPETDYIKEFAGFILEMFKNGYEIIIVVGGGGLARNYIKAAREFISSESYLDMIGIDATQLNARLLIASLYPYAYPHPITNFDELAKALMSGKIIVMGGLTPGQTTDAVSVEVAEFIRADLLLIGTNVRGIYNKDPKKHKDAVMYEKIKASELFEIVHKEEFAAGRSAVIDPVAAKLLERAGINAVVLDARDLKNMANAIKGKQFTGTMIV